MITQYELPSLIREELPTITPVPYPAHVAMDIFVSINNFTEYTKLMVVEQNYVLAGKCFQLAARLYTYGDRTVRSLIENIFVFSFSGIFSNRKTENTKLQSMIPSKLYSIYLKQVMSSGC
jgi:hypothetical protein